jgi:organic hydroperoxide reductase OsmC/OhrA
MNMTMGQTTEHNYLVKFNWLKNRTGLLHVDGKPSVKVGPPPQFGGGMDDWSPEDLLLASLASCLLSTFFTYTEKKKLEILSYDGVAEGQLKKGPKGFEWDQLGIEVKVDVDPKNEDLVRDLLSKAKQNCIIANSLKVPVELHAIVNGQTETSPEKWKVVSRSLIGD